MIEINGEKWRAFLVSPFHPKLQRSDGQYTLGCCDNSTKTIYISKDVKDEYLKKVLCHELTHAVMFSYNISMDYEQEEVLADIMATHCKTTLEMTNFLFEKLKEEK